MQVIIVGGGIAGLSAALSLHQIGVECRIYESVARLEPVGYGINLQPNAVRELADVWGVKDEYVTGAKERIQAAVDRAFEHERSDGEFGLWSGSDRLCMIP